MTRGVKFVQMGLGPIGARLCQLAMSNKGIKMVGAIELIHVGEDVGEVIGLNRKLGIKVTNNIRTALAKKPDIVLHSTISSLRKVKEQLIPIIKSGVNIVSTCEELAYPWKKAPKIASELDTLAKKHRVSVLATGVNPGFCMDFFPITLTGVCERVEKIKAIRIQDARSRRLPFQKKIGAGCTFTEFEELKARGTLRHVGLEESVGMIAAAMGWRMDSYRETIEPIIAEKEVSSDYLKVKPGQATGVEQIAVAEMDGKEIIRMEFRAYLGAPESYDTVTITGAPNMEVTVKGGIQGDIATAAMVINAIPRVINAPSGLITMKDLPPVHPFIGNWGKLIK